MNKLKLIGLYAQLHFIVVLLGFTAIIGALISIDAISLVWFRMFFATVGLFIFLKYKKLSVRVSSKQLLHLFSVGVLVALHWITFFHAIKVSNVSVTLGVFASITLFTSILEPITQKRRIFWFEVLTGLIIIVGIYLIFQYEMQYVEGIIFALLSALLNSFFVVFNRNINLKHQWHPAMVAFYEMVGGFIAISAYYLVTQQLKTEMLHIGWVDFGWILILSFVCTSYAFTAIVSLMRELSAYTVVLVINLEPVYGIFLAFLIFGDAETMSLGFYMGTLIIMISVFSYPFLKRKILLNR